MPNFLCKVDKDIWWGYMKVATYYVFLGLKGIQLNFLF